MGWGEMWEEVREMWGSVEKCGEVWGGVGMWGSVEKHGEVCLGCRERCGKCVGVGRVRGSVGSGGECGKMLGEI